MRPILFAGIFLFSITLLSQDTTDQQRNPASCTVAGQVVRADTGEALKSARLELFNVAQKAKPRTYRATSDVRGHFAFSGIASGRYRFAAAHSGFVPQEFHPENAAGSETVLDLSPGQKLDKVLFRLNPAAAITGRIVDEDGQPLAGVEMEALVDASQMDSSADDGNDEAEADFLHSISTLAPVAEAITNDLGEYRIYGLPAGDYVVAAIDSGMPELIDASLRGGGAIGWIGNEPETDHPPMYYPGVFHQEQAQKIHVSPSQTLRIDLTLRPERTMIVSGRVLAENGQPASGVYVILTARDLDTMFSEMRNFAGTDAQGRFEIKGVVPGAYVLEASKREDQKEYAAELPMEVADQPISDLSLKLEDGIAISGRVVATVAAAEQIDLASLRVWIQPSSPTRRGFGTAQVNKDGTFKTNELRRNNYGVVIMGLPSGWYLKSAMIGTTDVLNQGMAIAGSGGGLELKISPKAAALSGTVSIGDQPAAGIKVQLLPQEPSAFRHDLRKSAATDQHGRFVMESIVPGKYRWWPALREKMRLAMLPKPLPIRRQSKR